MDRNSKYKKKSFEALVRAVYALREIRDNTNAHEPFLTEEERAEVSRMHRWLDDTLDRVERTGIEAELYAEDLKRSRGEEAAKDI